MYLIALHAGVCNSHRVRAPTRAAIATIHSTVSGLRLDRLQPVRHPPHIFTNVCMIMMFEKHWFIEMLYDNDMCVYYDSDICVCCMIMICMI